MTISFPRKTALFALGASCALVARHIRKRKLSCDYEEFTYDSLFGPAEIFTMKSASGDAVRVLNVGGGFQSATYLGKKRFEPVFEYYRAFDHMFDPGFKISRILMIGGGGFSYPKHLLTTRNDIAIDVVELDPAIVEIARSHFYVDELESSYGKTGANSLNIVVNDGLAYLQSNDTPVYDVIINDSFDGANPTVSLLTSNALHTAKNHLSKDGLYMLNAVISEDDKSMLNTYMEIVLEGFNNVYAIRCVDEEFSGEDNWLIIGSDSSHYFENTEAMLAR